MRDTVEAFLTYQQRQKNASSHTIAAYRNDLAQFLDTLVSHGVTSWQQVSYGHVEVFLHWLQDRRYTVSTVARKIAAVRSFFHYAVEASILDDDPSARITPPRVPRKPPRALSADEVTRFLDSLWGSNAPKALRDRALLELLYATGMRVSEVIELTIHDLHQDQIRCVGKGGKARFLSLTSRAAEALHAYLEQGRPQMVKGTDEEALFVNHRGWQLTRQGLWLIVKERAGAAGIRQAVTPHVLRHSFAAHLLEQGAELEDLQERLGHATLATTQVYVQADSSGRAPDSGQESP